jgi:hypothetical protein
MNARSWLSPLVYLSNNWISLIGVILVTTAAILWLVLLPASMHGEVSNPYLGILMFMMLPGVFFGALALIPLGIWLKFRSGKAHGTYPANFPPLDFGNRELRKLLLFVGVTTMINVVIAGQTSYSAVNYMDGVTFCGQTCHTVMQPEYAAYQNSPHARVECVKCHIGPGAGWFVKSKLSGVGQVFAVTFNTYERPIPTPVENLRPARETCEACHWPQKYGEDKLRVLPSYTDDETNTLKKTVLLMRVGVIHRAHLREGVEVRYAPKDRKRQEIGWVKFSQHGGRETVYNNGSPVPTGETRLMDCVDCHNRPTHAYQLPERAVDKSMAAGIISPALPFAKKTAVEVLKGAPNGEGVESSFTAWYQKNQPAAFAQHKGEIDRAAKELRAIYERNVFPAMKVTWGIYPNNLGHQDFPGCFRCHDDNHAAAGGKKISQDCNTCHSMLAMEETNPKILADLGVSEQK